MTAQVDDTAIVAGPGRTVLCPGCGYDLRAATGDRCSECGLVLDRAALQRSGFPWAHRAKLGRLRAFLKTMWLVGADSGTIRHEAAKAQSALDGAAFRRWVAAVMAVCLVGATLVLTETDEFVDLVTQDPSTFQFLSQPGWTQDLLVPWFAGVTIRPALLVYAIALAVYIAAATRPMFRARGLPPDYAETVEAISAYVTAPLVWLLPATVSTGLYWWLWEQDRTVVTATWVGPVLVIATYLFAIVALGLTVYRTGQWRARTAHGGYPTGFLAMAELLARWVLGIVTLGGVFPWCVGFVWIALDSFRG